MKKIATLIIAGVLFVGTSFRVLADEEEPAAIYGGVEELADLKNHTDEIKELTYQLFGEGGETRYDATENAEQVAEFLSDLEIQEEVFMDACDCDEFFNFIFEDGTEMIFWFNGGNFRVKDLEHENNYITYKVKGFGKFHIEQYGVEME